MIEGREVLEARAAELDAEFGDAVPRPEWWGGFRLRPDIVEFWEGRPNRLHDRAHFVRRPAAAGARSASRAARRASARSAPEQHAAEHRDTAARTGIPKPMTPTIARIEADDGHEAGRAARQHEPVGALLALACVSAGSLGGARGRS